MAQSDFVKRGRALLASGQHQEAVKICRLGLLGQPTAVEGRVLLGQALMALRRYDEVLAEMRVALEIDHTSGPAYHLKGEALLRKGDAFAAAEALGQAKMFAPGDVQISALLAEAELAMDGDGDASAEFADVGDSMTKHYPGQVAADEEDSGHYTQPTSIASPGAGRRAPAEPARGRPGARASAPAPAPAAARPRPARAPTPPPEELAVGDKSGTVELDPDLEGIQMPEDNDLAEPPAPELDDYLEQDDETRELAAAKAARRRPGGRSAAAAPSSARPAARSAASPVEVRLPPGQRPAGAPRPGAEAAAPGRRRRPAPSSVPPVHQPDDRVLGEDSVQIDEPELRQPAPRAASRHAPDPAPAPAAPALRLPARPRPTSAQLAAANQPTARPELIDPRLVASPAPTPASVRPTARAQPVVAAMPTAAAVIPPNPLADPGPPMALYPPVAAGPPAMPQPAPGAVFPDGAVAVGAPMPSWARATMVVGTPTHQAAQQLQVGAAPLHPTAGPGPALPAPAAGYQAAPSMPMGGVRNELSGILVAGAAPVELPAIDAGEPRNRTSILGPRRRARLVLWLALGALVIGGGVFAGFEIRRMRLDRQVAAALTTASNAARSDTWLGWVKARDGLAGIVAVKDTAAARARLARARAVLAAEFGDDLAGARAAVEALGDAPGVDAALARGYLALASGDGNAAQQAVDGAGTSADPGVQHVAARAALLTGRWDDAARAAAAAAEAEARPMYLVTLAEAEAARQQFVPARAAAERALALVTDHPAALIVRARVLAASVDLRTELGSEVLGQLERVWGEGARSASAQTLGVSPRQAAGSALASARVYLARGDRQGARAAIDRAQRGKPDDLAFAEDLIELWLGLDQPGPGREVAERTLQRWPASVVARVALAELQLAAGQASAALELVGKIAELPRRPDALAVRGRAHLALGDLAAARTDLDAALAVAPTLLSAKVARAWVDLRSGNTHAALALLEPLVKQEPRRPSALMTVFAAALRGNGRQDEARKYLESLVQTATGADLGLAQLELGRLEREQGNFEAAKAMLGRAMATGGVAARLELALLALDLSDPKGGRETLEALYKQAPSDAQLVIELVRVRTLLGDLAGARTLLAEAEKLPGIPAWQVARERGRLQMRASDFAAATISLRAASEQEADVEPARLLVDALSVQGALDEADKVVDQIGMKFTRAPQRLTARGWVLLAREKPEVAIETFRKAEEEMRSTRAAPRLLADALFGRAVASLGTPAAATLLAQALKLDPTLVDAEVLLAGVTTDKAAAVRHLERAVELNPEYADAWFMLAEAAAGTGDPRKAAQAATKYLALAPTGAHAAQARVLAGT
ncbi:MAG: tetratricopeptide repeat protein [Kofleriaceae bacterium]|nr:tetratricopeptide repeat protein [Kofleriaceae bacterium]